jgi:tripartite-type tricarboxylate transporter receptor subunit TctC
MRHRGLRILVSIILLSTVLHDCADAAEAWPARPITLVVPLAPGGGSDGLVRVFSSRLGEILGQSVVVENVGGVGGMIGSARVAKAAPDGYQVLLGTQGTHALNQVLYPNPPYNAVTDFEHVALVLDVPLILLTRKDLPVDGLSEFAAYARANQARMQYGSSGVGGNGHLACALVNSAIGINVTHVPYRGGGPALTDLVGGRLDYLCALANVAKPQVDGGQAKAIAVLSTERTATLPDVRTAAEQGLRDIEAVAWNAVFLPKGTSGEIVEKLRVALFEALDTPAIRSRLSELGANIVPPKQRSSAYLRQFVQSEISKWGAIIKATGMTPQ